MSETFRIRQLGQAALLIPDPVDVVDLFDVTKYATRVQSYELKTLMRTVVCALAVSLCLGLGPATAQAEGRDLRRRVRGAPDRAGLFAGTGRAHPLDRALAGREGGGAGLGAAGVADDRAQDSKKTNCVPILTKGIGVLAARYHQSEGEVSPSERSDANAVQGA